MVLTTSHTATGRVLAVLTDAAVTGGHVAALFAVLVQLRTGKNTETVSTHTHTRSFTPFIAPFHTPRAFRRARLSQHKNPKAIAAP